MKKICLMCIYCVCSLGWMHAQTNEENIASTFSTTNIHNIPEIRIVSREVRGADEQLKYTSQEVYQTIVKNQTKQQAYISKLEKEGSPKLKAIQEASLKKKIANDYLKTNFPQERFSDKSIEYEMGNTLRRPFSYKKKTKFIIHHTVTDISKLNTKEDMYNYLRSVYKMHALKNGRGDIGYNYLIGPDGTVFEGRAGGEQVVGAHATRNNFESIGIALIGNFEESTPPTIQVEALIRLITQLSRKYHINPKETKTYHMADAKKPYLSDIKQDGIIGHVHVGKTQCPGKHLLGQLEYIKQRVYDNLDLVPNTIVGIGIYGISELSQTIVFTGILTAIPSQCTTNSTRFVLTDCTYQGKNLIIKLISKKDTKNKNITLESINLLYPRDGNQKILLGVQDVPSKKTQFTEIRNTYLASYPTKLNFTGFQKSIGKIYQSDIKSMSMQTVSILLYNTTLLSKHSVICDQGCTLTDSYGQRTTVTGSINIIKNNTDFVLQFGGEKKLFTNSVQIAPIGKRINISNTGSSKSYLGTLTISMGKMKPLQGNTISTILLTNQLPFRQYLYGIGEEDSKQHVEKLKTMSILVKNYALFYLNKKNSHPSIIKDQGYDFIDDPRIFQKYVGYDFQTQHPLRVSTVDQTRNQRILYDKYIVIMPYYHCSAGFTRSASEKFGRNDTPYLIALLDTDGACSDKKFQGHGVGLSGVGAQKKAISGQTYKEIIQYYYPGTTLIQQ